MRNIGVVTTSRADYGIYLPALRRLEAEPGMVVKLFVAGMHLRPEHGLTVRQIEADGFEIAARLDFLAGDAPADIAAAMGRAVTAYAEAISQWRPDVLLVLGDRFEMHAAALAALPFNLPVAHLHGGELTQGAMDDALRHSLTKLSHLHFVSTEDYARRVRQLGEEAWRVTVCGAPALDHLKTLVLLTPSELACQFAVTVEPAPLLITFHPVTLESEDTGAQVEELLASLAEIALPLVFTAPNADTHGQAVKRRLLEFIATRPQAVMVESFGTQGYFSMMAAATAMVGNSSSGIIEAPSFGLPVVNIGTRQTGRVRGGHVVDVPCERAAISAGLRRALSAEFRAAAQAAANPYVQGNASELIVRRLREVPLDARLRMKTFVDMNLPQ
jgi:UDP-hydrolysing UDP-N-acetyl-D-glucosamine 2-epimerase